MQVDSRGSHLNLEDGLVTQLCTRATDNAKAKRAAGEIDASELTVEAVVEPANFNSPGQVVIAGSTDAVAEAVALAKAGGDFAGAKAIPLSVSAPFHCKLMKPARSRMAELFALAAPGEKPRAPAYAYVPNRTARLTKEAGLVFEMLIEQVDHPVLWKQTIAGLLESGYAHAAEFGPGKVLAGLNKRIAQQVQKTCATLNVNDGATLKAFETALKGPTA